MTKALTDSQLAQARKQLQAMLRQEQQTAMQLAAQEARTDLLKFTQFTMEHPDEPENPDMSLYDVGIHHRIIARELEEVEQGKCLRLILTAPPRHGKSELTSRRFPAVYTGRNPSRHIIFSTYNDTLAKDFGRDVRSIIESPRYKMVYPEVHLDVGSKAADRLATRAGGKMFFIGRGGSTTGRGADLFLIDDPIKDAEEADSLTIRDKIWFWFTRVASTRLMTSAAAIVIILTRWHEDDVVGRLTDPQNSYYNADEAAKWKIVNLPALAGEDDPLFREPDTALWPSRFNADFLKSLRAVDSRGFSALYQGTPAPEDGEFFKRDMIKTYKSHQLPPMEELRPYGASDHAVSTAEARDATVLMPAGVDSDDNIWVLPDVWWRREKTDKVVEAWLMLLQQYPFFTWWAEKGHISKSIGPFLRQRMAEEKIYVNISEQTPIKDKQTRAQPIMGRMAMGKVLFPEFAPWWPNARHEMLKFPYGSHDDFVDALAHLGMGLNKMLRGQKPVSLKPGPKAGTFGAMKAATRREERDRRIMRMQAGW